ncbi:antirestriction protein ArdA [Weissella diestrammenae]|uniref:Antirestriction protein ArdA n=1 Tax=Weissella diestrammenae TaxID=1162633 RepID=A0A7G9T3R2_9LACO|nr:antirestriction protein ArdA [Weissella diestrammenae]MCM0582719.1 antirestriction protein ArdA [Weissella diestrammenae]QNN74737.1 antirestriction protein ArdA [Weissella diestrammenae]
MTVEVKIFVGAMLQPANGKWFTLPTPVRTIEAELERIGAIGGTSHNEEYMITDYEAPFKIDAHTSINLLNQVADELSRTEVADDVIKLLFSSHFSDIQKFNNDEVSGLEIIQADNQSDLAYEVLESIGGVGELPADKIESYFDYDAYGRDLLMSGDYSDLGKGVYIGNN